MFKEMNEKEVRIATKLINHGLFKAAGSLEQVLNSPIKIKAIDFAIAKSKEIPEFCTKKGGNIHVLNTQLIGELNGVCHLILSEDEVAKVHKACLPDSILSSDTEDSTKLKSELLTEIDNIVAATAITQFANYLNLKMYGGIPGLTVMDADKVNQYINKESETLSSIIHFKAYIHGTELDIIPDFVWLIEDKFIEKIRAFADSNRVSQLEDL